MGSRLVASYSSWVWKELASKAYAPPLEDRFRTTTMATIMATRRTTPAPMPTNSQIDVPEEEDEPPFPDVWTVLSVFPISPRNDTVVASDVLTVT